MDLKALLGDKYKEDMTLEDVIEATKDIDVVQSSVLDDYVLKSVFDTQKKKTDDAAHDAAEWKRKYRAQLNEDEKNKQEREDMNAKLMEELETLRKEKTVSEYERAFITQGYDSKLAHETAIALAEGDMQIVFTNQNKFNESLRKEASKQLLNNTPEPPAGNQGGQKTKAIKDMSLAEMQAAYNEDPNVFNQSK